MINEWRISHRELVHDVLHYQEATDGAETGCGLILPSKNKVTYEPTSCLTCISGNVDFDRTLKALQLMKTHGIALDQQKLDELSQIHGIAPAAVEDLVPKSYVDAIARQNALNKKKP